MGATLPKAHHQPPLVQYQWVPHKAASHQLLGPSLFYHLLPAVKLRDILYGYQRKVAVCSKEEVGGLFYELSIFNLEALGHPSA